MIDIHFHALPGIDDGPEEWGDALALCRAAAAEGTRVIVATPHVLREPWLNEDRAARRALVAELNERLGGTPRVLPGCEYWFTSDVLELVEAALRGDGPLEFLGGDGGDGGTGTGPRHLLVEFSPGFVPRAALDVFHELSLLGVTPVIAHPERNIAFLRDPGLLEGLVDRGAKAQLTAASVVGDLGRTVQAAAEEMWLAGFAHVIASDAHSLDLRPPMMAAAREWVRSSWGEPAAVSLFDTRSILANSESE